MIPQYVAFLPQPPHAFLYTAPLPLLLKPFLKPHLQQSRSSSVSAAATATTTAASDPGLLFRRKLIYLESLNVNSLKALRQNPQFRSAPLKTLKSVENCLRSMGLPRSSLGRIFDMHPQLLTSDPHLHLYPVFEFLLNDVEIPFDHVARAIIRCPRLLVSSVDAQLRPALLFLRRLGFVGKHRINCQTSVLLVSSVENTLVPKLEFLVSLGFSESEVENMVVRSPALLTYSIENNLRPKSEYFAREMKGDFLEIKRFPQYFSFSLEGRIKPRYRLSVEHGFSMHLWEMLKVSDGEFNVRLLEKRLQLIDHGQF